MARSGDADLAMGLFPHSFVDLEEVPLVTPKLTLITPRRGVRFTFRQIGLKELSQQPMVLLQPVTTTRAVIDGAFRVSSNVVISAFVAGEKIGGSSRWLSCSPSGSLSPASVPRLRYSLHAEPLI